MTEYEKNKIVSMINGMSEEEIDIVIDAVIERTRESAKQDKSKKVSATA